LVINITYSRGRLQRLINAMKITVAGLGYVGLSLATLLAQRHQVTAYDIDSNKIKMLQNRISPIADKDIPFLIEDKNLKLFPTDDRTQAFAAAEMVFIATPTNYDSDTNRFDTSSIEQVIEASLSINPEATIVIKSTVPVGYTESIRRIFKSQLIVFSPEFLREGFAVHDNQYPSRIVVGDRSVNGERIGAILSELCISDQKPTTLLTGSTEAEAIKLFSNTYLAMRVSFFNEIDTFTLNKNLEAKEIVDGVCLDSRIGSHYNNPSFGYGGYCLPKDTRQLLANYIDTPQDLISAIVKANHTRKSFIAAQILKRGPKTIGIFRVTMKAGSDNFRSSSVNEVIGQLKTEPVDIVIYEPYLKQRVYLGSEVIADLDEFKQRADVIVANRRHQCLNDVMEKVFSRDLFGEN